MKTNEILKKIKAVLDSVDLDFDCSVTTDIDIKDQKRLGKYFISKLDGNIKNLKIIKNPNSGTYQVLLYLRTKFPYGSSGRLDKDFVEMSYFEFVEKFIFNIDEYICKNDYKIVESAVKRIRDSMVKKLKEISLTAFDKEIRSLYTINND